MLSGPALIKTQTQASLPGPLLLPCLPLSPWLLQFRAWGFQALLPQLTLVWAEQFLFTHTQAEPFSSN